MSLPNLSSIRHDAVGHVNADRTSSTFSLRGAEIGLRLEMLRLEEACPDLVCLGKRRACEIQAAGDGQLDRAFVDDHGGGIDENDKRKDDRDRELGEHPCGCAVVWMLNELGVKARHLCPPSYRQADGSDSQEKYRTGQRVPMVTLQLPTGSNEQR